MYKEVDLKIKNKFKNKFKAGYPHLFSEAILNPQVLKQEGQMLKLVDEQGQFLGRGYYGKQNKSLGWVLTQSEAEVIDVDFYERRLQSALKHRDRLYNSMDTTAFRVFNGEGDGVGGLTIDYYDGYYLMTWYSFGIYQFKDLILTALKNSVDYKGIYQKKRFDTGGHYIEDDDFVAGERAEFPLIVQENGVNFAVYLNEGPMTGIFLDQRDVRKAIRDTYSEGKSVLNTFSYTGAFSVAAALGGASKTTSVDLANRSLPKTIEQFKINGLDEKSHEIRVIDVFNYFKYAVKKQLSYDLVILDPPSFARSKKRTFSVVKDYVDLLKEAIAITAKDGVIVASTNYSGFGISKFNAFIAQAFKEMDVEYEILETFALPDDFKTTKHFKEGNYLKVVFIRKNG